MPASEHVIGMAVHGQPLAGVEQLDQQRGAGAMPPHGTGAEIGLRIGVDRVAEQPAVG